MVELTVIRLVMIPEPVDELGQTEQGLKQADSKTRKEPVIKEAPPIMYHMFI
jgi:hypothetical protein